MNIDIEKISQEIMEIFMANQKISEAKNRGWKVEILVTDDEVIFSIKRGAYSFMAKNQMDVCRIIEFEESLP